MTSDQFDEATQKAMERIQKLLNLANNNPNEAEAASAMARAQEMLAAYNLDLTTLEVATGAKGARLDAQVSGGMFKYQRSLMSSIAKLNFCWHWVLKVPVKAGSVQAKRGRRFTHEQRLLGRKVNVVSTQNMADYLNKTIERLCRDRLVDDGMNSQSQFYSSWALAFREGIADRVMEKIATRRRQILDEEEQRTAEAARRAAASGISTATALTLASLEKSEYEANYDFLNGVGAFAKKKAEEALRNKEWEEQRARAARAREEADKRYAEWAAANPEEAAKAEAAHKAEKRHASSSRRRSFRFRTTQEDHRKDSGGYAAGYEAGRNVSIDPQASARKTGALPSC